MLLILQQGCVAARCFVGVSGTAVTGQGFARAQQLRGEDQKCQIGVLQVRG